MIEIIKEHYAVFIGVSFIVGFVLYKKKEHDDYDDDDDY